MAKRQFVKVGDYEKIKELSSYGIPLVKVAKATGWSVQTVVKVLKCDNFAEYIKKNEELSKYVNDRRRKRLEEARQLKEEYQSKATQPVEIIPAEIVESVEQTDQLTRIADALERLIVVIEKRRTLF